MFRSTKPSAGRLYIDALRQKKNRRRRRIAFLVVFSVLALLVFSVYAFFFSGWFSIKEIRISGNKEVSESEILGLANGHLNKSYLFGYIRPYLNIIFASSEKIERSLAASFPVIDEISVDKDFSKRFLAVEVGEREAIGIWCPEEDPLASLGQECLYFDKELVLFKPAPRFSGQLFLVIEDGRGRNFKLGDSFDDKELFEKILAARELLEQLQILEYSNFYLTENSFEFWVKTSAGWPIYLDKETDVPTQLVALKKFLEEKLSPVRRQALEYIDLRVNNRIYYK